MLPVRLPLRPLVVVLSAVLAVAMWSAGDSRAEAAPARASYVGSLSDGGTITLVIDGTGDFINIVVRFSAQPAGCPTGFSDNVQLTDGATDWVVLGQRTDMLTNISHDGFMGDGFNSAVGAISADPVSGSSCPRHRLAWVAVRAGATTVAPLPGVSLAGAAYLSGESAPAGTAQLLTDSSGAITTVTILTSRAGCSYGMTYTAPSPPIALTQGHWNGQRLTSAGGAVVADLLTIRWRTTTREGFAGAFRYVDSRKPECADGVGTWTATRAISASSAPAPSASPATVTKGFTGNVGSPGVSLVQFSGSVAELNAAAAGVRAITASATVGGRLLTFVVGAPEFVNSDFNAAFPSGLQGTFLILVK